LADCVGGAAYVDGISATIPILDHDLDVAVAHASLLAKAGIRFDYPEASAEEVREELARRRFGQVLADEVSASQRRGGSARIADAAAIVREDRDRRLSTAFIRGRGR
jgi:hypothetical protein